MALLLEDFAPAPEPLQPAAPAEDLRSYEDGLTAGRAEAEAAFAQSQDTALADIAQRLSDLEIGYSEARTAVLESLAKMFEAILNTLLPSLADATYLHAIHQSLMDAATRDSAAELRLILPANMSASTLNLPQDLGIQIAFDDALTKEQAIVASGAEETFLDTAQVLKSIAELMQVVSPNPERIQSHG